LKGRVSGKPERLASHAVFVMKCSKSRSAYKSMKLILHFREFTFALLFLLLQDDLWREPFRFACKRTPRKQRMSFPSVWDVVSGFSVNCEAKQPPRPASAEPEARHVGCFFRMFVCRVLIPPPEGRGGRDSKRGWKKAASVGRRPRERRLVRLLRRFCAPFCLGRKLEIAICDFKNQSSCGVAPVAEPSTAE